MGFRASVRASPRAVTTASGSSSEDPLMRSSCVGPRASAMSAMVAEVATHVRMGYARMNCLRGSLGPRLHMSRNTLSDATPSRLRPAMSLVVEVRAAVQADRIHRAQHFDVGVELDDCPVALDFHRVSHGCTPFRFSQSRMLATAPLSVSGPGCVRWKTHRSPNSRNADPGALSLTDLRTQFDEQRFDVSPRDIAAGRMANDRGQGPSVPTFHDTMVPQFDTALPSLRRMFVLRPAVRIHDYELTFGCG